VTRGNTLRNAAVGAVTTLVLFFVPFSPVVGGTVAGYLQDRGSAEGLVVGSFSGILAALPGAVVGALVAAAVVVGTPGSGPVTLAGAFLFGATVVGLYAVVAAAIGGAAGSYLHRELDGPDPTRLFGDGERRPRAADPSSDGDAGVTSTTDGGEPEPDPATSAESDPAVGVESDAN
jgi:hypothetical protein